MCRGLCLVLLLAGALGYGPDEPSVEIVGGRSLPRGPLVVNGGSGSRDSDGSKLESLEGGLESVRPSDPILRIAHVMIVPDASLKAKSLRSSSGNTPDKFVWRGDYDYEVNGKPTTVSLRLDGRAHSFHAAGQKFDLAKGNFFRIRLMPGPRLEVKQFPVIDVIEDDRTKIWARFSKFDKEEKKNK